MNLNAITLAISRPGGVRSWDPLAMFTSGVQGVWYDPSDLTTLYQDAAGTTPVTAVEQPVGLTLDKSKGLVLGPELVTNGDFSNGTNGWSGVNATLSQSSGTCVITADGAGQARASQTISTVAGKWYEARATVARGTGALGVDLLVAGIASSSVITSATPTDVVVRFAATGSTTTIRAGSTGAATAGTTYIVDNISVRELPGNHAFNSSGNSANFPVLSARYNLLTKTEDFSDAAWVKTNATVTTNAAAAPNGEQTADLVTTTTAANTVQAINNTAAFYGGAQHTLSFYVRSNGWRWIQLRTSLTLSGSFANLDVIDGVKGTESGLTSSIQPIASGWFRVSITVTTAAASGDWALNFVSASNSGRNANVTGDGTSGIYIWGADLRVANDALNQPAYQRVNTATDYDTVGFKPYLRFNGTNQWLQTNNVDFTYGDKMFVSAGVRKLSDAAVIILETSTNYNSNNGAVILFTDTKVNFGESGTGGNAVNSSVYSSPATQVLSALADRAGATGPTTFTRLGVNGVDDRASYAYLDNDAGNFGNYPLYIGARAGSSLWFNGRLYGMVVAGKQASADEIDKTEDYLALKTGFSYPSLSGIPTFTAVV